MVKVGLLARIVAKPGMEEQVAAFLQGAQPLAEQEKGTVVWFAFRLGPREFGIYDAFGDEAGRQAHLEGAIANALMTKGLELLSEPPRIDKVDVLAAKLT